MCVQVLHFVQRTLTYKPSHTFHIVILWFITPRRLLSVYPRGGPCVVIQYCLADYMESNTRDHDMKFHDHKNLKYHYNSSSGLGQKF
jgi:hypothetical protein